MQLQRVLQLVSAYKAIFGLLGITVFVAFVIGFAMAGVSSEHSKPTQYSVTTTHMPELVSQKFELFAGLMAYGHWDAELDDEKASAELNLENFHEYMKLVGISESGQGQEALFIIDAPGGWQSIEGLEQIDMTPDGRIRAVVGKAIAPHIQVVAIENNRVDLSVNGEIYSKQLYLTQAAIDTESI